MKGVLKGIKALEKQDVYVGIPESHDERKPEQDANGKSEASSITNAAIGRIAELGSPKANIPQRKWLQPSIEGAAARINKQLEKAADAALDGRADDVRKAYEKAGLIAQNAARARVNSGIEPALAKATLAARRRRGRTGTKPLVDTAQFRNAITYVIRRRK